MLDILLYVQYNSTSFHEWFEVVNLYSGFPVISHLFSYLCRLFSAISYRGTFLLLLFLSLMLFLEPIFVARVQKQLQWNPFLTTFRIATTIAITTFTNPHFFFYLSHTIYFYNNEYKNRFPLVITTTLSESLGVRRKETR